MVEHRTVDAAVEGSSPFIHPNKEKDPLILEMVFFVIGKII